MIVAVCFFDAVQSGLQKQPGEIFSEDSPYRASIQAILEKGIERLKTPNQPQVYFSSR